MQGPIGNPNDLPRQSTPIESVSRPATSARSPAVVDRSARLARIAQLVADGQLPLPLDLSSVDLQDVTDLVRQHRHVGMVRHIARCIARDIARCSNTSPELNK